jgi:hypothetical protein
VLQVLVASRPPHSCMSEERLWPLKSNPRACCVACPASCVSSLLAHLTVTRSLVRRLRYTISLQAVLAPGDQVQQVLLAGSISNDTGERPLIATLFGVEAIGLTNQSGLGVVSLLLTLSYPTVERGHLS